MGLLDFFLGSPRPRRRRKATRRKGTSSRRDAGRQRKQSDERARRAQERARETAERKEARRAAAEARRQVRKREREHLLIQRQQLELHRRQEHQAIQRRRHEARMEARARRDIERRSRSRGGRSAYIAAPRSYEEVFGVNPKKHSKSVSRRRNSSTRVALGAAARSMRGGRARNPFWGDVAKGVLTGLLTEEVKGVRQKTAGPFGQVKPKRKKNPPRRTVRKNPATLVRGYPDPKLRQMSQRFHGRPDQIVQLGDDQRRAAPKYAVLVGREEAIAYRPPRGSQRGGSTWEHQAGDRGPGRRANGRRLVVADSRGRTYVVPGTSHMKWDPDAGLVG